MRVIKNVESTSVGKTRTKNDDGIFIGKNFAAVFDGVSTKSAVFIEGKKIRVADIIIQALKTIDGEDAPSYAKELDLNEFLQIINMYIKKYCDKYNISLTDNKLEATGAIYSKYHNQIWIVGDCKAVYNGKTIENDLKADELYTELRLEIINSLFKEGYTPQDIFENDFSEIIIDDPEKCSQYIKSKDEVNRIKAFIKNKMHQALLDTGFTEEQIIEENLLQRFYKPKILQEYAKNNPEARDYGYSVFNGIYTPVKYCKVEELPDDVGSIRLSTDGFPTDILKKSRDLGMAIRRNRILTKTDPISIKENLGIHNSSIQDKSNHLAFDDESAIEIRIEEERESEEISR